MKGNDSNYSRVGRKRRRSRDGRILNLLIGLVVVLIIIVGATLIFGGKDDEGKEQAIEETQNGSAETEEQDDESDSGLVTDEDEGESGDGIVDEGSDESDKDKNKGSSDADSNDDLKTTEDKEENGTAIITPSDEDVVKETVVDPSWAPIGTEQTGEHVSQYDGESVDWYEKRKAVAIATGHPEESLIYWKIKNGGGPQKSISIVSTRDQSEKYRVYLEWVDGQGWKPVKMDVLNTLEFDY